MRIPHDVDDQVVNDNAPVSIPVPVLNNTVSPNKVFELYGPIELAINKPPLYVGESVFCNVSARLAPDDENLFTPNHVCMVIALANVSLPK